MKLSLLADDTRVRVRIPACYLSTHRYYSVYINPDMDTISIRLSRTEKPDYRPAPRSGSYVISIRGAIILLLRVPPRTGSDLEVSAVTHNDGDVEFTIKASAFQKKLTADGAFLVSELIGRV